MISKLPAMVKAWRRRRRKFQAISHHQIVPIQRHAPPSRKAITCFMVVRDESLRMEDCLSHYRRIGVDRFAIIDNGSTDDTPSILADQPDVDLYRTENSYAEAHCGFFWQVFLASRYGFDRWHMVVDPDELLVFDGMERHDLHDLADYLTRHRAKHFFAPMIDMYAQEPLEMVSYQRGNSLIATCPHFDGDTYLVRREKGAIVSVSGGARARMLTNTEGLVLDKYPLFYMDKMTYQNNVHEIYSHDSKISRSGALLHFKFLQDFKHRSEEAVAGGEHWNGAEMYQRYIQGIRIGSYSKLYYSGSVKYHSPESLISAGLIDPITWDDR